MNQELLARYQAEANKAIEVQNACNASGVIKSLSSVVTEVLWPIAHENGHGTDWVNTHPIVVAYLDKLESLARVQMDENAIYRAFERVEKIAAGTETYTTAQFFE